MKIKRIIWWPDFEDKLYQKHSLSVEEVEEALFYSSPPHIRFMEKGSRKGGIYLIIKSSISLFNE